MSPREADGGQATVELALVLPFVVALFLLLVQVGLVVRDQVLVVHAAREGARQAAVDPSASAVQSAVVATSGLARDRVEATIVGRGRPGSQVRVRVRYRAVTNVPLVGLLVGDVDLTGTASMRVET